MRLFEFVEFQKRMLKRVILKNSNSQRLLQRPLSGTVPKVLKQETAAVLLHP